MQLRGWEFFLGIGSWSCSQWRQWLGAVGALAGRQGHRDGCRQIQGSCFEVCRWILEERPSNCPCSCLSGWQRIAIHAFESGSSGRTCSCLKLRLVNTVCCSSFAQRHWSWCHRNDGRSACTRIHPPGAVDWLFWRSPTAVLAATAMLFWIREDFFLRYCCG